MGTFSGKKMSGSGGKVDNVGYLRTSRGRVGKGSIPIPRFAGGKGMIPLIHNSLSIAIRVTVTFHNPGKTKAPAQALSWIIKPDEDFSIVKNIQPYVRHVNIEPVDGEEEDAEVSMVQETDY